MDVKLISEFKDNFDQKIKDYITIGKCFQPFGSLEFTTQTISNLNFENFSIKKIPFDNKIKYVIFRNCKFDNFINKSFTFDINFIECSFNNIKLNNLEIGISFSDCKISEIKIENSEIIDIVSIVNKEQNYIDRLLIFNTTFKNHFNINNIKVGFLNIINTNFEKNFIFTDISVNEYCCFNKVVFNKIVSFYKCIFDSKIIFKNTTFNNSSYFRNSTFNKGIDLEYTNIQGEMNFFGIKNLYTELSKQNTSQETYRIIKHQFEKLGNKIEANKYHALELEQKRKKLENEEPRNWQEYLVFKLHDLSSEHSTNWLYPILWSLAIAILTVIFVNIEIVIDLFFHPSHFKLEYIGKIWNEFWQYCYIGNMSDKLKDSPLVFLLNKGFLGYLYYQFLMSVRKDTRK